MTQVLGLFLYTFSRDVYCFTIYVLFFYCTILDVDKFGILWIIYRIKGRVKKTIYHKGVHTGVYLQ